MLRYFLLTGLVFASACSDGCGNTEVVRTDAPDQKHVAAIFERNCGATTGFSTQISILTKDEKPAGIGNVFVATTDHGAAVPGDWGGPWAQIRWIANDHLLINYAAISRVSKQANAVSGIKISYEQVDP